MELDIMGQDFAFSDDGRRVQCTRGGQAATAVEATGDGGGIAHVDAVPRGDGGWWYLTVADTAPVRLREVTPGETRRDVWESALDYLDASA